MKSVKLYKQHQTGKIGWWKGEVVAGPGNTAVLHTWSAAEEGGAAVEHREEIQGKNIGRSNETTPFEQACKELESKANKKMDKGYTRTAEEASTGPTNSLGFVLPQKAKDFRKMSEKVIETIDWDNAYVQRKLDGHRAMVVGGQMYSSGGKPIDLPHLAHPTCPLHLDGELYIHGVCLQDIGKLVKKYRKGETEKLEYHVFDVVSDKSFYERATELSLVFPNHPQIVPVKTYKVTSMAEVNELNAQFLAEGYEGAMIRQGTNGYNGGARNMDIIKVKGMDDHEWPVIAVFTAKPKLYRGEMIPQAMFTLRDAAGKTFDVLAPGTTPEKAEYLKNPRMWIGKQLTVQHFGYTKDGLPNLPVAKCFRSDL